VPTLCRIAGGLKGNALNEQIMAGKYPGIVKTKLDGVDQTDYLTGKSEKSAREVRSSTTPARNHRPCATRTGRSTTRWCRGRRPAAVWGHQFPLDQLVNHQARSLRADGRCRPKSLLGYGGALAAPGNAYIYDWNMLPIGQLLWLKELSPYKEFPPLQAPASYNLDGRSSRYAEWRGHNGHD
jgi:hypothetical protein